jgi:hypothetical protein
MFGPRYTAALVLLTVLWAFALVSALFLPSGPGFVTATASLSYALGGLGCLIFGAWLLITTNRP